MYGAWRQGVWMRRRLAVGLILLESLLVAYAATVLLWRDAVTGLCAPWQQHSVSMTRFG